MLQSFHRRLDQRLSKIELTSPLRDALAAQRNKLAGTELPEGLHPDRAGNVVTRAIEESFVGGFRVVMGLGALLAVGSAVSAAVLIHAESREA